MSFPECSLLRIRKDSYGVFLLGFKNDRSAFNPLSRNSLVMEWRLQ